jgi:CheY-like chemotaxis protein
MFMNSPQNNRILIVDDNRAIHSDFKRILAPSPTADLDRAAAELFGDASIESQPNYELTYASQGLDAVEAVRDAIACGNPFALAFVDMRMPPGFDGVETISRIWRIDPDLFAVICTAYSDRRWEQIVHELGETDQLFILKKPFDSAEVMQIAYTLSRTWNARRETGRQMEQFVEAAGASGRTAPSVAARQPG